MSIAISISNSVKGDLVSGGGGVPFVNEYSMTFDETDLIQVGTSSLGITSAITVSAWVKIPTTNTGGGGTNIQTIICEDTTSGGQRNWNLSWRGTGYDYFQWVIWNTDLSATSIISTGVVPNDGFWHHVMGTYDGTSGANGMKLYIDGVLNVQGTASSTGINSFTATEATIGALTGGGGRYFLGEIDSVAVWDNDESSNINSIYSASGVVDISSLNPLSWWRMGDGDSFKENLLVYSEDLTQSTWTKTGSTISADSIVAPDGLTTADKVVEDISAGSHFVQKTSVTIVISETYNLSVYLKAGERNIVRVASAIDSSVPYANLDLTSGSVLFSTYANTPTLTSVGNDWYRFDVTIVANNAITPPITVFLYNGSSFTYTGDGVSGAYVWGAQLTNSSSVLDYVQTTNLAIKEWLFTDNGSGGNDATSTTLPESARLPITANSYSQNSFVFDGSTDFVDLGDLSAVLSSKTSATVSLWFKRDTTTNQILLDLKDGTSRIALQLYLNNSIYFYVNNETYFHPTSPSINQWYNLVYVFNGAGATNADKLKMYLNGTELTGGTYSGTIDTSIGAFTSSMTSNIGRTPSTAYFDGNIDEVYIWDNDQSGNISTIYGNGVPTDISSLNPLGHWRFGETDTFVSPDWTFVDQGSGGNDGTSSTLPEEAKTGDQPYVL